MTPMPVFEALPGNPDEMSRIKLPAGFDANNWRQVDEYYRPLIAKGFLQWELDLTEVKFCNSTLLGMLIAFNAHLVIRGGALNAIVAGNSQPAQLLRMSLVHRIMSVTEV